MNPSGLWRGITESDGRIGHFKFINVELIPQRVSTERKRRKSSTAPSKGKNCFSNNQDGNEETTQYQVPIENGLDLRGEQQFVGESSQRKYPSVNTNVMNKDGSLKAIRNHSDDLPSAMIHEPNFHDEHKSVEGLLRRIGLEVCNFKIMIFNNFV